MEDETIKALLDCQPTSSCCFDWSVGKEAFSASAIFDAINSLATRLSDGTSLDPDGGGSFSCLSDTALTGRSESAVVFDIGSKGAAGGLEEVRESFSEDWGDPGSSVNNCCLQIHEYYEQYDPLNTSE